MNFFPFNVHSFLTNPNKYLNNLRETYGDPFPLALKGSPTIWLTADHRLVKSIFTAPADSFMASEKNPVAPLLGTAGLIMLSGTEHLKNRSDFSKNFSKSALMPFAKTIEEVFLQDFANRPERGVFSLQSFALNTTLKIILKFIFPNISNEELIEAESLTNKFLNSYSPAFLFLPKWTPFTWNIFLKNKLAMDKRLYELFLKGIESGTRGPLNHLLNSSKEEVADHIRTFIVAGHETSSISLVWALYYILNDSKLLSQVEASESNLENIINEVMRIAPPVPFITRKIINRSFRLGEKSLNIGEEIGVCINLLHKDPAVWDLPFEFNPGRFRELKYSSFEYAPFGGGTRKCIGAELAYLELKIIIKLFLKHYDAKLLASKIVRAEVLQITVGPKKMIDVTYNKKIN